MKRFGALLIAVACSTGVESHERVTWALEAAAESTSGRREEKPPPLDGRALWRRSLELQRVPSARLDGTLTTTTASHETRLALHLVGRLAEDGVSRMLLVRITGAGALAGSAVLTVEHQKVPHDIWIYLPALGAPRRLFGGNLGESFLGSEFRLGDLLQASPGDYAVTLRGTDHLDGRSCQ